MLKARRIAAVACAALVAITPTIGVTTSAGAGNNWSGYTSQVTYTVYKPYETLGLARDKLTINQACSVGVPRQVRTLHAVYRGSGGRLIKLYEIDESVDCIPPGGGAMVQYVPAKTFPVQRGAGTATLWMDCQTALQCEFPSNELIKDLGAWVMVPLRAVSPKFGTHAYVYTKNVSYKRIKKFVRGLDTLP
jgi:hypothetical protein